MTLEYLEYIQEESKKQDNIEYNHIPTQESLQIYFKYLVIVRSLLRELLGNKESKKLQEGDIKLVSRGSSHGFEYWDTAVNKSHLKIIDLLDLKIGDRKKWARENFNFETTTKDAWLRKKIPEYKMQIMFMVLFLKTWKNEEEKDMQNILKNEINS